MRQELTLLEEENRTLKEEVGSLRQFINSLQQLMDAVDRHEDPGDVFVLLEAILNSAMQTINASDGSLLVLDEDSQELVFVIAKGQIPQEKIEGIRLPPGEGVAGWVVEHRKPAIVPRPRDDERFFAKVDENFDFQTNSILAVPILGGGRILGVIELLNKQMGRDFNISDQTLLMLLCRFAGELLHELESRAQRGVVPEL